MFSQVLLADEINRASPRTQSALLEAMASGRVSVDGTSHPLPQPFFVIATQNGLDQVGTAPLPESQLDRFLMRLSLGFPPREAERALLAGEGSRPEAMPAVLTPAELEELQERCRRQLCTPALLEYVLDLVALSRDPATSGAPLSPRRRRHCWRRPGPGRCSRAATTCARRMCRRCCRPCASTGSMAADPAAVRATASGCCRRWRRSAEAEPCAPPTTC